MSTPNLGWLTWLAMLLVLGAAAVLSFAALRDLAELCGVEPGLAWLLPISVDAGAAVSTRIWLSGRAGLAERYARNLTWALLSATVAGNAVHSGLVAANTPPAWWVAVLVGAVPPAIVGAVVHLAVLVGRPTVVGDSSNTIMETAPTPAPAVSQVQVGEVAAGDNVDGIVGIEADTAPDRAAELIAGGVGRRRLARELGMSEHEARELLAAHRNGNGQVTR